MPRLEDLPVELLLYILQYLPLQGLYSVRLVSRSLNNLITTNESTVYHNAALLHNYVSSLGATSSGGLSMNLDYPVDTTVNWKSKCKQCFELDRNWAGQGSASMKSFCDSYHDVHRIKVDEGRGLLMTTHENGGLRVTDTTTGEELWRLSTTYVKSHAHLEYEQGFLIFDRFPEHKEVWRLASDFESPDVCSSSPPDTAQLEAYRNAESRYPEAIRGHFRPWALLLQQTPTHAFRFVYPTLAEMSLNTAFLWDVPSGVLAQTIHDLQGLRGGSSHLGTIVYVDVSAQHVVVCGWQELRVFNRADGALVLRMPAINDGLAKTMVTLEALGGRDDDQTIVPLRARLLNEHPPLSLPWPAYIAVHVSRTGRDLVAMLSDNRIILLKDFERVSKGQVSLADAAVEVIMAIPKSITSRDDIHLSVYLAFEHGRVSMVTTSGVYVLVLDTTEHGLLDPEVPQNKDGAPSLGTIEHYSSIPPHISYRHLAACQITQLTGHRLLSNVSCLQMTATKLYLTWSSLHVPQKTTTPSQWDLAPSAVEGENEGNAHDGLHNQTNDLLEGVGITSIGNATSDGAAEVGSATDHDLDGLGDEPMAHGGYDDDFEEFEEDEEYDEFEGEYDEYDDVGGIYEDEDDFDFNMGDDDAEGDDSSESEHNFGSIVLCVDFSPSVTSQ